MIKRMLSIMVKRLKKEKEKCIVKDCLSESTTI